MINDVNLILLSDGRESKQMYTLVYTDNSVYSRISNAIIVY